MKSHTIFIEQSPNAIAVFDTEMRYIIASHQWLTDYGLTRQSIVGKSHYEIFPEISEEWKAIHQECLRGTVNKCDESIFRRADGSIQWISWEIRPWNRSDGSIGGIIIYTSDITRHKTLELELSIQEEQFRRAFETSAIGMALVSLSGQWIKVNDSLLKILGYERERLYKITFQDITHPDDLNADLLLLQELVTGTNESYQMEKRYFRNDGHVIWALLSVAVVRDIHGNPLHFVSQIMDITETKRIAHLRLLETDKNTSRIAYELHENIAQTLASIKIFLNSAIEAKTDTERDLNGVDDKLSSLLSDIKGLSEQIVPTTYIQQNLETLISDLAVKFNVLHQVKTDLVMDDYAKALPFSKSYHLFRIVEDQMKSAILRHASCVKITLTKSKTLILKFSDNGEITLPESDAQIDLLVNNVKTRVEMLDGVLSNTVVDIYKKNTYSIQVPVKSLE